MAFLYNQTLRRVTLALLTIWSVGSFWALEPGITAKVLLSVMALFVLMSIYFERYFTLIIVFISFTSAYSLYGFLFYFNLPLWIIMISAGLVFGYLFLYFEQKAEIFGKQGLIYLLFFDLIVLELFVFLSYLLVSPINRSLVVALSAYLLISFSYSQIKKDKNWNFRIFSLVFAIIFILMLVTANWGG